MKYLYRCSECGKEDEIEQPITEQPPHEIVCMHWAQESAADGFTDADVAYSVNGGAFRNLLRSQCTGHFKRVYEPTNINYGFREGKHGDTEKFQFKNLK